MYTFETRVRYSETNQEHVLTIPALTKYLQDTCIFDSEQGSINIYYLEERHLAWVLNSWQIVIERLPKLNEKIKIHTVPYEFKGFIGYRNFSIEDENGTCIVKAASIWSLIDMETMKPFKPTQEILEGYPLGPKLDMEYAPRRIAVSGEGEEGKKRIVHKAQIDTNHHMNNSEYISLAYEYLPEGVSVSQMRVEYKMAAYIGDTIVPVIYKQEEKIQVQLNDMDMNPYAVVEFLYE